MELEKESLKDSESEKPNRSLTKLFIGAQIAAFAGTAVDFLATILLTELAGIWYVASNAIGAGLGAITNFLLGRYWVFLSTNRKIYEQAFRYVLVSVGSLILNTLGVWLVTEYSSLNYVWSKIIVAVLIAVTYNFILQKNYVYK